MEPRIWLIAGPTASGKSALALRLAQALGGEIVNADALQLYADLPILTACPSADEKAQAPHHLFGVADAADGWSVGRWARAAMDVLSEIEGRGRAAIVVGGTGLYFSALTQGLADIPAVPAEARAKAQSDFDGLGEDAFRARLALVDPAAASRIAPGDRQRLCRAWEVIAATDVSLSDWQARTVPLLDAGAWQAVALEPDRAALYARCDRRLTTMISAGALEEVAQLAARELPADLPVMKAVGYRELAAHLRGETSLTQAIENAQRETRRYAKRQSTWLRGQMAEWPRLQSLNHDDQWRQFLARYPVLTP